MLNDKKAYQTKLASLRKSGQMAVLRKSMAAFQQMMENGCLFLKSLTWLKNHSFVKIFVYIYIIFI